MSFLASQSSKKLTLILFVLFLLEYFPFFASIIMILLSWHTIWSFASYPYASMNKRVHNNMGIRSSIPTSLDYVELRVLRFCFEDVEYGCPSPILTVPPVCPRKYLCTPYDVYIHHLMIIVPSDSIVRGNHLVDLIYLMVLCNFFQSYISVYRICAHRKDTAVWTSGLYFLDR